MQGPSEARRGRDRPLAARHRNRPRQRHGLHENAPPEPLRPLVMHDCYPGAWTVPNCWPARALPTSVAGKTPETTMQVPRGGGCRTIGEPLRSSGCDAGTRSLGTLVHCAASSRQRPNWAVLFGLTVRRPRGRRRRPTEAHPKSARFQGLKSQTRISDVSM